MGAPEPVPTQVGPLAKILAAPKKLSGGALALVSLGATAVTSLLMSLVGPALLTGTQRYDDIVVGEVTFANAYKHGDIVLPMAAIALFLCSWWILVLLAAGKCRRQCSAPADSDRHTGSGAAVNWLPALVPVFYLAVMLVRRDAARLELAVSAVLLVESLVLLKTTAAPQREEVALKLMAACVTALGVFFSVAGLGAAAKFLLPQTLLPVLPPRLPLYAAAIPLLLAAPMALLPQRTLFRITYASQLAAPLCLFAAFSRVYGGAVPITPNLTAVSGKSFALALTTVALLAGIRRYRETEAKTPTRPRDLLLTTFVLAAAAYAAYGLPPVIETDFFHGGEQFLAWQQVFEKGQVPFSGFAIARGFVDAMPGMCSSLFFDGTYVTKGFGAWVFGSSFAAPVTALLLAGLVGNGWALVVSLCGVSGDILMALLLLFQPKLIKRPLLWLGVWLVLCPFMCVYHATSGIALTMGTFPVALWFCYGIVRERLLVQAWRSNRLALAAGGAVVVLGWVLLFPLVLAWIPYVFEQGKINEVANGTALLRPATVAPWFRWQNRSAWEGFRVGGWIAGLFLLWHLLVREWKVAKEGQSLPSVAQSLILTAFCTGIAFIPYAMGRIDNKALSRTGVLTVLIVGAMVPLALLVSRQGNRGLLLPAAVFLLGIGYAPNYEAVAAMAEKALRPVEVPEGAAWAEPGTVAPRLGGAFADPKFLENIAVVRGAMDRLLLPQETYVDLTNHLALFYLLDRKVPSVYASYYTAPGAELQQRVIKAVAADPPPLVWAGPARTFDSGTASLRSYRTYRWFVQHGYVPWQSSGLSFLVRKDRYRQLFGAEPPRATQIRAMAATFDNGPLGGIPLAWGNNFERLAPRFVRQPIVLRQGPRGMRSVRYPVAGATAPGVCVDFTCDLPVRGASADFLLLRCQAKSQTPFPVRVSWSGADGSFQELQSLSFDARGNSYLLVPLGSNPAWLMSDDIRALRFEFAGVHDPGAISLAAPVLLYLKN